MRSKANRVYARTGRKSYGKTVHRSAASLQGTLSNYAKTIINERTAEREKSRVTDRGLDLYTNDAMGHGILEGGLIETIGIGLTPSFTPMAEMLSKDDAWSDLYESQSNQMFKRWGLSVNLWCDAQQRLNFYGLQALSYFQRKVFGTGLFKPVFMKNNPRRPLSLAVQALCPSRLETPSFRSTKEIYDGFEIGKYGEPVAAYIRKADHPIGNTLSCFHRVEIRDPKTGLRRLFTPCDVRNVAEYKEDSLYSTLVKTLRDANDMTDAVLVGALVRNLYVGFVKNLRSPTAKHTENITWEDRIFETGSGTIVQGYGKEDVSWFNHAAAPQRLTDIFTMIHDRYGAATARGVENVLRKFQSSYSASKASMEKADEVSCYEHGIQTRGFDAPFMALMQYEMVCRNYLPVNNIDHFLNNIDLYYPAKFLPQPMRQIDRKKAAEADATELRNGTISLRDIHGRKGNDWRTEMEQIAKEKAYIKKLEEKYDVCLTPDLTPASTPEEKEDDDES